MIGCEGLLGFFRVLAVLWLLSGLIWWREFGHTLLGLRVPLLPSSRCLHSLLNRHCGQFWGFREILFVDLVRALYFQPPWPLKP